MKIEISKIRPGEECFIRFALDNGNWIVYRAKEVTNTSNIFTVEPELEVKEFAQWFLINQHKETKTDENN